MKHRKGPHLVMKALACIVFIAVLAAWIIPCHEDAPVCQGSLAHSDCCGGHSVPYLSSVSSEPQVLPSLTLVHPHDQQFTRKIFTSDIYRPPRV